MFNRNRLQGAILFALLLFMVALSSRLEAQRIALRTNLLALATANINIEGSLMLTPSLSVHLPLQVKPVGYPLPAPTGLLAFLSGETSSSQHILKVGTIKYTENYTVQPGLRYWSNGVYNRGVFLGVFGIATKYRWGSDNMDVQYKDGYGFGGGVSLGYSYELSTRWNIEGELGVGALWRKYKLGTPSSATLGAEQTDVALVLPRIGVSLVYILK